MDNKYEIVRSVSKTVQEKQFEPRTHFSSHKMGFSEIPSKEEIDLISELLQTRAEWDVFQAFKGVEKTVSKSPEEEYFTKEMPPQGHSDSDAIVKKVKGYTESREKQYEATDKEGGKKEINRDENTLEPK